MTIVERRRKKTLPYSTISERIQPTVITDQGMGDTKLETPPNSVSVVKKGAYYYVIVHEGGSRIDYGPFMEHAASTCASNERKRLGLAL